MKTDRREVKSAVPDHGNEHFGVLIKNLREEASPDQSRRAFAKSIGMDPSYLARIELGVYPPPSADVVIRMADTLGIDRRFLLEAAGHYDPLLGPLIKNLPDRANQVIEGLRKIQGSYYMPTPGEHPFPDVVASSEAHLIRVLTSIGAGPVLRALADLADELGSAPLDLHQYESLRATILKVLDELPHMQMIQPNVSGTSRKLMKTRKVGGSRGRGC